MSVLVDTGVLHGFLNTRDSRHKDAHRIMEAAMDGAFGPLATTTYILDEAITLALVRRQPFRTVEHLLGLVGRQPDSDLPHVIQLRDVQLPDLAPTIKLQARHWDRRLSFTDCVSLHVMERDGIDRFATFDETGFRGLVTLASVP